MKNRIVRAPVMTTLLLLGILASSAVAESTESSDLVIGTFDSRCVALAYYRSDEFLTGIDAQKAEYEAAVEAGDTERAEELGELGPEQQELAHERVFSTGDIDEIIWTIWSELPGVAEEAGVDLIVSTWDIIYRDESFEFVDVTDLLVVFFDPSEETLDMIETMQGMPAIPSQFINDANE